MCSRLVRCTAARCTRRGGACAAFGHAVVRHGSALSSAARPEQHSLTLRRSPSGRTAIRDATFASAPSPSNDRARFTWRPLYLSRFVCSISLSVCSWSWLGLVYQSVALVNWHGTRSSGLQGSKSGCNTGAPDRRTRMPGVGSPIVGGGPPLVGKPRKLAADTAAALAARSGAAGSTRLVQVQVLGSFQRCRGVILCNTSHGLVILPTKMLRTSRRTGMMTMILSRATSRGAPLASNPPGTTRSRSPRPTNARPARQLRRPPRVRTVSADRTRPCSLPVSPGTRSLWPFFWIRRRRLV
jgi:hypothetical protein